MATPTVHVDLLETIVAICRLDANDDLPEWVDLTDRTLVSVTRTTNELSIILGQDAVPPGVIAERGWRVLAVRGPLAFSLTGVLASLAQPLGDAGVPIFALSTYDTDLVLVGEADLDAAITALEGAGHEVHAPA